MHRHTSVYCWIVILAASLNVSAVVRAQPGFEANYDEAKMPEFELPPVAQGLHLRGSAFESQWKPQREQLLKLFATQMYGTTPTTPFRMECDQFESGTSLGGKATRRQYRVTLFTTAGKHSIDLLIYHPADAKEPVPAFLGLSFYGNHTVSDDPEIAITQSWCRTSNDKGVVDHRATEAGRGSSKSRWPIEMIIASGCAVATAYCGDIDPDFHDEFENGVHALFPEHKPSEEHPERWGTIAAWSWGLSRMLDCISENVPAIDSSRVVVVGHSRLGKTALWTAARDGRFAGGISNDSGCGGAALSRRAIGETVQRINHSFPHWFCGNFKNYDLNENALAFDQHQLVALVAPRIVYVASASQDKWADPKGEFLAARLGSQVYEALGGKPLGLDAFPNPGEGSVGAVSYHLREGKHDINAWDWERYLEFIDQLENR